MAQANVMWISNQADVRFYRLTVQGPCGVWFGDYPVQLYFNYITCKTDECYTIGIIQIIEHMINGRVPLSRGTPSAHSTTLTYAWLSTGQITQHWNVTTLKMSHWRHFECPNNKSENVFWLSTNFLIPNWRGDLQLEDGLFLIQIRCLVPPELILEVVDNFERACLLFGLFKIVKLYCTTLKGLTKFD